MAYFPLFFDLQGKKVLIVGAGRIGGRRICKLHEFGAELTVVAEKAEKEVRQLGESGQICFLSGTYEAFRETLLQESYFLVLAATGVPETDDLAERDWKQKGAFVNIAGEKERSDFYVPGIVKAGELTIGITAGGQNHRLVRRMTERLQEILEEEQKRKQGV